MTSVTILNYFKSWYSNPIYFLPAQFYKQEKSHTNH